MATSKKPDPMTVGKLRGKAREDLAQSLQAAAGSTIASQEAPGEPQVLLAPPGGPDRGTIPEHSRAPHPGPMPAEPPGVWPFGVTRLTALAATRDRAALERFDAIRLAPAVGIYRSELLAWLDRVEAYEKSGRLADA